MSKFRIKRDDTVLVIAGKHKGTRGRVLRVMPDEGRLVVEGVNRVKRHQKPVGDQPGSIVEKEAPIAVSNVALWDEKNGRRVKVAIRKLEDGKRVRVDRKSGATLDNG